MTLISVEELKTHIETDLPGPALERLLADAEDTIVTRFGPNPDEDGRIVINDDPSGPLLFLSRPVATQDDVDEILETSSNGTETVVDPTGYRIMHGGYTLQRIGGSWAYTVKITYAPNADLARRVRVAIDLVQLAIENKPVTSTSTGDHSETKVPYEEQRNNILRALATPMVG